ncbi:hypothetical protein SLEP1_g38948 [Rubroshorea leprosula]|uniref:Uncharacterized protein n=1 Tax=Rubroshorea leprosula TaxID=152421 RepID=A0AAV5KYH9_9ROSI|nr:hypothetical protein SLEP1_g38948 [Rubroshorea leprosula]
MFSHLLRFFPKPKIPNFPPNFLDTTVKKSVKPPDTRVRSLRI